MRALCRMLPGLALLAPLLLAGCGREATRPKYVETVAVFGYLYVGEGVTDSNAVVITRTRPVDQPYDPVDAAVNDAVVTLQAEGAATADTLRLVRPGRYAAPQVMIQPRTTYHLRAQVGSATLTASTTTPEPFETLREPRVLPDVMRYSTIPDSFPIVLTCPDPEQVFLVDVYCLERYQDARYVHPAGPNQYPKDYDEYGGDNGPPRHIWGYFHLKDLGGPGPEYLIGFYGDMMAFYGAYTVGIFSIDQNYYDYLYRDHPELNGGIHGGIGVFGSAGRRQYHVRVIQ